MYIFVHFEQMITYERFFNYIKDKSLSQNELLRQNIINNRLLNAMRHNKCITTDSINKLCNKLNCTPNDILTYTPDQEEEEEHNNESTYNE